MKKSFVFLLALGLSLSLFAQDNIDILSLSGRYGLPKEYDDATYTGKATEWGSLNSLTAGFKLGKRSMLAINVNHFYFNVQNDPNPEFPAILPIPLRSTDLFSEPA